MSIKQNGKIIAGASQYHPDLFDWKWADHELNDISWLRADTFSWQSGAVYESAYQHLVDDISGKTLQTETGGGATVSFYLADDGHKICPADQETNIATVYGNRGVAWFYILDTANQRFKLPRTKFGVTGLRDTVGNYVAESLPNIRGYNLDGAYVNGAGGSFVARTVGRATGAHSAGGSSTTDFDASVSSSAYQDDAPVQERATQMYLYFYVGSFTQSAIENTAGLNASLFNGKADVDLSNTALATADYVIESQEPTAANGYTWYRKYRSGWVEQGGFSNTNTGSVNIALPIEMADSNYSPRITQSYALASADIRVRYIQSCTTTTIYTSSVSGGGFYWQVSGMAA